MGDALNPDCEIVRYASGGFVDSEMNTVSGGAFKPRPADEGKLSVNRLGVFCKDFRTDLDAVRRVASDWMTIRKTGRFAQITASNVRETLREIEAAFLLEDDARSEDGKLEDPSHALLHGIPTGEDDGAIAIRDLIALTVTALHDGRVD